MMAARCIVWASILFPVWTLLMWNSSVFLALAPTFCAHVTFLVSTLIPNCTLLGNVQNRFVSEGKSVWLTIDDGPDLADTQEILDLLLDYDAKATFFLIGSKACEHPELVRKILQHGHHIANHTQNHPGSSFWIYSTSAAEKEIREGQQSLERISGTTLPMLFRAPVGLINPMVHLAAAKLGFQTIGWSARGFDTVARDAAKCAARIIDSVRPGSIILLHQGIRARTDRASSIDCIRLVIEDLSASGYSFIIPEAFGNPSPSTRQNSCTQ